MKTNSYMKFFPKKGWVKIKTGIPSKVILDIQNYLRKRLKGIKREMDSWMLSNGLEICSYSEYQKDLEILKKRKLPVDLQHFLKGEFDLKTRLSKNLYKLFGHKKLINSIQTLLNTDNAYIHYPPMLRFKFSDSPGSILPPHQDFPYSPHLKDFITIWLPLVRIDKQVGGLVMYNGSQKLSAAQSTKNKYWSFGIDEKKIKKFKKEQPLLKIGEALVFPSGFVHGSALQLDKKNMRLSIDFRIFTKKDMTSKALFDCKRKIVEKKET